MKLWDVKSGREITLKGSSSFISISFSPDSETLADASGGGTVKLWDIKSGREIKTFEVKHRYPVKVMNFIFSPDSKTLASVTDDGTVKLWNLNSGREIKTLEVKYRYSSVRVMNVSAEDKRLCDDIKR